MLRDVHTKHRLASLCSPKWLTLRIGDSVFLLHGRRTYSAKCGIAAVPCLSVRPSVCLSAYNADVPWPYKLGYLASGFHSTEPQYRQPCISGFRRRQKGHAAKISLPKVALCVAYAVRSAVSCKPTVHADVVRLLPISYWLHCSLILRTV